jgi:hypothetical protein
MDIAKQDPDQRINKRVQIGSCDWVNCGRPAYYEVDMDCDDESAFLCGPHYDGFVALLRPWLPTLFKHDGDDDE